MLIDNLKNMFSGNNKKKKVENLVFLLVILVVTVIAINTIWNDKNILSENKTNDKQLVIQTETKELTLEEKLENILSKIDGTGNVEVLLTYNESTEIVPIYNESNKKSITNEVDSNGGTRTIEETDIQTEVIYNQNADNNIITKKTVNPKIEGAIVIATGADNSVVKTNIMQAVEAATGLASHKIQVFKKQS